MQSTRSILPVNSIETNESLSDFAWSDIPLLAPVDNTHSQAIGAECSKVKSASRSLPILPLGVALFLLVNTSSTLLE